MFASYEWSLRDDKRGNRKKRRSLLRRISVSLISHCQTVRTRQPAVRKTLTDSASRSRLRTILRVQNPTLLLGNRPFAQPCPCQKQPCTNTTVRCLASTISGRPGKSFRCNRNRKPSECNSRRTSNSGPVSRLRTLRMIRLRCSGDRVSMRTPIEMPGHSASTTCPHHLCSFFVLTRSLQPYKPEHPGFFEHEVRRRGSPAPPSARTSIGARQAPNIADRRRCSASIVRRIEPCSDRRIGPGRRA